MKGEEEIKREGAAASKHNGSFAAKQAQKYGKPFEYKTNPYPEGTDEHKWFNQGSVEQYQLECRENVKKLRRVRGLPED